MEGALGAGGAAASPSTLLPGELPLLGRCAAARPRRPPDPPLSASLSSLRLPLAAAAGRPQAAHRPPPPAALPPLMLPLVLPWAGVRSSSRSAEAVEPVMETKREARGDSDPSTLESACGSSSKEQQ